MKKFRIFLLGTAVLAGVGSAVASGLKAKASCIYFQQYRFVGGNYLPVSDEGDNYLCFVAAGGVCTYWKPDFWSPYTPCTQGEFIPLF